MSAGTGILHSEKNDSWTLTGHETHSEPVHFVQMWVVPDESGIDPGYQQLEIDDELLTGGLVTIASGMPEHRDATAINIRNRYAALHGALAQLVQRRRGPAKILVRLARQGQQLQPLRVSDAPRPPGTLELAQPGRAGSPALAIFARKAVRGEGQPVDGNLGQWHRRGERRGQ